MNKDFETAGNNQLTIAQDHYLKALRALVIDREAQTGIHLNNARSAVLPRGTHWPISEDAHFEYIRPDLNRRKFEALYGDFGSEDGASPWVCHPQLLRMVRKHLSELGTEADVERFDAFMERHRPILEAHFWDNIGTFDDLNAPKPPFPAQHIA